MCKGCCENIVFGLFWCYICCGHERKIGHSKHEPDVKLTKEQNALVHDNLFWTADPDNGASYDVDGAALASLQGRSSTRILTAQKLESVMPAKAHTVLATSLAPSQHVTVTQTSALQRLRQAYDLPREHYTPDLLIKIIPDIDTVLFGGVLTPHFRVKWSNMRSRDTNVLSGTTTCGTVGGKNRFGVAIVRLNKHCFFTDTKAMLWGIVVHEMLHVYLNLMTVKSKAEKVVEMPGRQHDACFADLARMLAERLDFEGLSVAEIVGLL